MNFGDQGEQFHEFKQMLRGFIIPRGWRRCGRTKKAEVYKKKFNGIQYRIKFTWSGPVLDRFYPKDGFTKSYWSRVNRSPQWTDIQTEQELEFLQDFEELPTISSEEQELNMYLARLGVAA